MNKDLTNQIVKHIFANLGVLNADFVGMSSSKSLVSKEFQLSEKLAFESDSGPVYNNVWGCQISSEQQEIKILLGDCSIEEDLAEYCLIVQLKDAPAYGLYLTLGDSLTESMIAVTINGTDWMQCYTFLQATFLAGMEQVRDMGFGWIKCHDYHDHFEMMKSFIKYHELVINDEELHEGQEG